MISLQRKTLSSLGNSIGKWEATFNNDFRADFAEAMTALFAGKYTLADAWNGRELGDLGQKPTIISLYRYWK